MGVDINEAGDHFSAGDIYDVTGYLNVRVHQVYFPRLYGDRLSLKAAADIDLTVDDICFTHWYLPFLL